MKEEEEETNLKEQYEIEKLKKEIEVLEKPWYKKPNYFVPLISAISSILILWFTGFFNTKIERISIEVDRLENKQKELRKDSLLLVDKIDSMLHQIDTLKTKLYDANSPFLTITGNFIDTNEQFGLILRNEGTGKAYIKSLNARFEDKWYRDLCNNQRMKDLLQDMGVDGLWTEYFCFPTGDKYNKEGVMTPGREGETFLIRVINGKYKESEYTKHCKILGSAIERLYIEIEYCSFDGKCKWLKRDFENDVFYLEHESN